MEAASGSAIPTKLCVLDAVTPAKRHRAQQFTGGKNIGVPATLARNGVLGSYPSGQLDGKRASRRSAACGGQKSASGELRGRSGRLLP